ncbi:MAG: sigma-70 family RNA polymerase sigma factor, partial [Planctomycetes bacterium]|nr:sigma-70 family RNA polymerase sigma factor [Planctomycetota bacterium]
MHEVYDAQRWQAALAHQGPLLALAQRLLGDPSAAEDAVAHALLQHSRSARPPQVPRLPFLRAVVRNFARRVLRDAARRTRHEAAAARTGVAPAADEIAAREQLRRRVADAVLALREPYRTTVALVHLEGLPTHVVAQQFGVAETTVRVRLLRARGELRRRLDQDYGARGAWAGVLAGGRFLGAKGTAPVAVLGVLAMKKLGAVVVAALLLGAGSFVFWASREPAPPAIPEPVTAAAAAQPDGASPSAAVRESAVPLPVPVSTAAARPQAFRCVDEQGQPVAGAEVRLRRGRGTPDLVATSDDDGHGVFADLEPGNYRFLARAGNRHRVQDLDPPALPRPGAPLELVLQELWIGGVEMSGVEIIVWSGGLDGGRRTDQLLAGPLAEKELIETWRSKHPGARFWG